MRYVFAVAVAAALNCMGIMAGCKSSSSKAATFCDTACLSDTLKFSGEHALNPYVFITTSNCNPESIIRSHKALGASLKTTFGFEGIKINKDFVHCKFKDTSFVYILFNDCITGRGFQVKLPFSKTGTISKRSSGINGFDPKFAIAEDMIAYTDRGNIYVEQVNSGKKAMMTFGKALDIDYNAIHEFIDSVNVTSQRIWVKVKVDNEWKELEKKIVLE
jgi:hypothetical protein